MHVKTKLRYLEDRWDDKVARELDEPELLRYRSNLLGSDLRITNFGGGNTSSKIVADRSSQRRERGSIVDQRQRRRPGQYQAIRSSGTLSRKSCTVWKISIAAPNLKTRWWRCISLCAFGKSTVAASIDTPLHGFLPYRHIDHLHPDWGIALAASANGREKMEEFNRLFEHHLIWVPWQRPGFELAMMLRRAVQENPKCDGVVLGGHGLFTWGDSQRECYENTIAIIDQLGQFVVDHVEKRGDRTFSGARKMKPCRTVANLALDIFPFLRGRVSSIRRLIGNFSDLPEVLRFVNSAEAEKLAHLGTSCPDHFIRTKVRPLFVPWNPERDTQELRDQIDSALKNYRKEYAEYYQPIARPDSPAMRDANPTVVLIPGIGMFSFGKSKTEARLTGEFYVNAIHVMEGATSLGDGKIPGGTAPGGTGGVHQRVHGAFELRGSASIRSLSH